MNESGNLGNLEEESLKRKERLKALKRKATLEPTENANAPNRCSTLPKPKFRSYKPTDTELKELVVTDAKPGDVEKQIVNQLSASNQKKVIETLDVSNLAPRKPDWDLKRDAAKKIERLERRTQRAIVELIRERLKEESKEDLATSVAIGAELDATGEEE